VEGQKDDPADAAFAQLRTAHVALGSNWQHRKGGWYTVVALGVVESDLTPAVVYRSRGGRVWIRPLSEFLDGRFERLPPAEYTREG
jgi:hypothetical protein